MNNKIKTYLIMLAIVVVCYLVAASLLESEVIENRKNEIFNPRYDTEINGGNNRKLFNR